ncbi:MAG: DUF2339 domain-containing protein [Deltaproteobacteria bacterium]|nr:DUF2339 domain-containing protein [Deltaproteobacteria bacterium]
MIVFALLLGAFIGGVLSGFTGALTGMLLGYAIWSSHSYRNRLSAMEQEVATLREKIVSDSRTSSSPIPAARAENEPLSNGFKTAEFSSDQEQLPPDSSSIPEWSPEWPESPPAEPPLPEQKTPERPSPWQAFLTPIQDFLAGGSLLVKTGIIVLFVGVSFLVKYAAEHSLLPIELRLSGAALAGVVLLALGWRLRIQRTAYAHALQGGGIAILYLTTFAALRLYALIPPAFAFAVLVAVAVLSAILAVLQDSRSLALLGASGGFLAPILASTGTGSHVVLFSYYALLNLGIAGIAWFRSWRMLNLIGFSFTFVIGTSWGWKYYRPEFFTTTEPFLILFFLIYTFLAVLFALRQPPNLKGYVDGTLVFGTPIVAFALQALLVEPYHFGLAWSALGLGLFYLPLAWLLFLKRPLFMRTLAEAFFAFGIIFATLTIPFALDGRWTSAAWALEGAALLWVGVRQHRQSARVFGMLLQFGAGSAFLTDIYGTVDSLQVFNGLFLGTALIALTGVFSAYILHRHKENVHPWEALTGFILLTWGLFWWFGGGLAEIDRQAAEGYRMGIVLVFLSASSLSCAILERRLAWPALAWPALALLPAMLLSALAMVSENLHPLADGGFAGWPLSFAGLYLILYRHESLHAKVLGVLHSGALWLLAGLLSLELAWQLDHWIAGSPVWPLIAWGLIPALLILLVVTRTLRLPWPLVQHDSAYLSLGAGPLALAAWVWPLYATVSSPGDPFPLGYLPVLNPLDVTFAVIALVLPMWLRRLTVAFPDYFVRYPAGKIFYSIYFTTLFLWLNGVLVRTIHHWGGIPFRALPLYHSVLLQAVLSIFWSFLALCIMVYATRKGIRTNWLTGAGLLALVVIKLLTVDLSGTGTVARIVSFVGVGILLLIIGYFSPAPPHKPEETQP